MSRPLRHFIGHLKTIHAAAKAENAFSTKTADLEDAMVWCRGGNSRGDHKIETRQRDGIWRHILMNGGGGYSAANPMLTINPKGELLAKGVNL